MKTQKKVKNANKNKNMYNLWKISSIILAILLTISLLSWGMSQTYSKNEKTVSKEVVNYINNNLLDGGKLISLKDIEKSNGMYKLLLDLEGQEMESYVSIDGKMFFPQVIKLSENHLEEKVVKKSQPSSSVTKANKPKIELFVMSECPYGTQMEKGILPVIKELGDNIDFELKFVNYAMHGKKELDEQILQSCISKNYKSKLLTYLGKYLEAGNTNDALNLIDVSRTELSECIEKTDKDFRVTEIFEDKSKSDWNGRFPKFLINDKDNKKYDIKGSPTLVINGEQVKSARDANSLLNTICSSFTNAPEACKTDMTSYGNPAPGFGFETQGGSAASAGCGA